MSTVFVQVGQCGNQIGQQFWGLALKDKTSVESHILTHWDGKLISVNVDSERKVVQQIKREIGSRNFRDENIILGRQGRGANWALGYHGAKNDVDDHILEETIEAIGAEVERCEVFGGILMMHSLSGGTGSVRMICCSNVSSMLDHYLKCCPNTEPTLGLGSHLLELLRDEFPMRYLLSCTVAPHASGESPLQHYNALLCLDHLQKYTDGVCFFSNDEILHSLEKKAVNHEGGVSMVKMNSHIASSLAGILLPTDSMTNKGVSIGEEPWELIRSVCPMPATKFIHINHLSRSKLFWDDLTAKCLLKLPRYNKEGKMNCSLGNVLVARGDSHHSFPGYQEQVVSKVKSAYNCVPWNPFPVDVWTAQSNSSGGAGASSITIASNYSSIIDTVEQIRTNAQIKYNAGAFLHWYSKYGCEKSDFEEAFHTADSIISEYHSAIS